MESFFNLAAALTDAERNSLAAELLAELGGTSRAAGPAADHKTAESGHGSATFIASRETERGAAEPSSAPETAEAARFPVGAPDGKSSAAQTSATGAAARKTAWATLRRALPDAVSDPTRSMEAAASMPDAEAISELIRRDSRRYDAAYERY